ncbi:MAG: Gfo/Idh/MocA family oxidoreductase [Armatimonadetes bacterium]|nr:Gfo/Idh/MocA family oxidoreductase [Armatimonadota bacterium]
MSEQNESNSVSRRDVIKVATAGVAATTLAYLPSTAEGMRRILGANSRIHTGHVGLGVQGSTHTRLLHERKQETNTEIIGLCDLYGRNLKDNKDKYGTSVKDGQSTGSYLKMLENKDIDAVWVATSDNWHSDVSIAALKAGKHVYCEKPMCKTIEEAFAVYDTVKATGKKFQVGSQGCSDMKWHVARKVVASGTIGHVVVGQGSYMRNGRVGEWNNYGRFDRDAGPTASGDAHVDWETFRKGKGPKDFDPDRFFRWRKYWAYGSGLVGDLLPHRLHPLFIAMNLPTDGLKGFPVRVGSFGGLYVQKTNPVTGKPDRDVPDFINMMIDYEDCSLMAMSSCINEQGWPDMIRGNKASVYFGGGGVEVKAERAWADEVEGSVEPVPGMGERIETHHDNFLEAIRENKVPNANIDIAVRVMVGIALGEMAYRQNKTFTFDAKTRTYKGA